MNFLAVVVAAVAAFVMSVAWYTLFAGPMANLSKAGSAGSGTAAIWTMPFVVAQSIVVAFMVAYFVSRLGISGLPGAAGFGALVWIFPAAILLGSVVHEGVPPTLAGIHAGDWLAKLILIAAIVGIWRYTYRRKLFARVRGRVVLRTPEQARLPLGPLLVAARALGQLNDLAPRLGLQRLLESLLVGLSARAGLRLVSAWRPRTYASISATVCSGCKVFSLRPRPLA